MSNFFGLEQTLGKIFPAGYDPANMINQSGSTSSAGTGAVSRQEQINLASGHYLKLGIALQLVEGAPEEVDGSKALDAAIDLFSGLPVEEVATAKERRALKEELATTLEEAYDKEVMGVYFTEFVTQ